MKYRSFRRLVVQLIPEATMSPGGIDTSAAQQSRRQQGLGKVLDGQFYKTPPADRATAQWPSDSVPDVKPGDTVVFSLSAPREGMVYFLSEEQVYAVLND